MSSILVKKPIGFYPVSGSNTGYYQVEGGGISRPSEMTDMFDTLSIKCRFRWPSFGDSAMGGLFSFKGSSALGLILSYQPGTDGSSDSVGFISGRLLFTYGLPSLPVSGSDDEVEYRIGSNKVSLLYHGEEVASAAVSDSAGEITEILGRVFTLGVYQDATSSYYYPGLISSAEITWLSSAVEGMSCVTNYYAAENITDSVWRNTADGVVVGVPIQYQPIKAVFYDSSTDSFVKLYPDEITEAVSTYTPIGVEVIPAEHDVYGTGQAGIMSLAEMNYNTPDVGGSEHSAIRWGGWDSSAGDTSLPNFDTVNYLGIDGQLNNDRVQGSNLVCLLPSDMFVTSQLGTPLLSLDGSSYYVISSGSEIGLEAMTYGPSPYTADGSRNEAYYTTASPALATNALSDFDGIGNTAVLTELATAQSDWKTATTITNNTLTGYYPAACCTWRFHTAGTDQGQWYFPACGEFGYVINRISAINTTINKVLSVYSSVVAVTVANSGVYWVSSEYQANQPRLLFMNLGLVNYGDKNGSAYVRAFLRL